MNSFENFAYLLVGLMFVSIVWSSVISRKVFLRARRDENFKISDEKTQLSKLAIGLFLFGFSLSLIMALTSLSGPSNTNDIEDYKLALLLVVFCSFSWFICSGLVVIYRIFLNMYLKKKEDETSRNSNKTPWFV